MTGFAAPRPSAIDCSRDRLSGTRRCDVAIVGAGLTGLSAAVRLLELDPDLRVAVVEADHVAAGGSGRGTGLLGPRIGPALRVARSRHGDEFARAAYLWSVAAVRHVLDLVERYQIPCDLTRGSQLIVASDAQEAQEQEHEAAAAQALGLDVELVPPAALPPVAARYASGLRYAPAATLDPAALTDQLARIGEHRGLTIFERSPVRAVRAGLLGVVSTDDGALVADQVVIATNGFGSPGAPAGVLGVRVQAGVTEKLPHAALAELDGLATEPLIGHGELTPYFRLTPDGRLVVGGGAIQRGSYGSAAVRPGRLRAAVRGLSAALASVELEASWAGPIGVTRDGLPVAGRQRGAPGVYYAGGCNGHGLAASVCTGALLAQSIVHGQAQAGRPLPWLRSRPPWVPGGRLTARLIDSYLARLTGDGNRF